MVRASVKQRRRAFLLPFVFNHVEEHVIERNWIGSQNNLLGKEKKLRTLQKRTSLPQTAQAVHNVQNRSRSQWLNRGQRSDERVGVGLFSLMRPRHVRKIPVGDVLQATRDTRRPMLLHR